MADCKINYVCEGINHDKEKFERKQFERIELDSFSLALFWNQFGSAVQAVSNEVTKIGFMCGKRPFPSKADLNSLLERLLQHYIAMRDLFLVLPEEVGATVYKATTAVVLRIMAALVAVVHSLKDMTDKGAKERLTLTGTLWDACNAVDSIPKNNVLAVLSVLDDETSLTKDALEELTTTIEEDEMAVSDMTDEVWTNEERELASRALGLVKVTHYCLQRLGKAVRSAGSCDSPLHSAQLDQLAAVVSTVSAALDDFVSELYHPINVPLVMDNASKLAEVLRSLLSVTLDTHLSPAVDKDRERLLLFINHNHNKLDPAATNPVPQLGALNICE